MKRIIVVIVVIISSNGWSQKKAKLDVINSSNISFQNTLIAINWNEIQSKIPNIDSTNCVVLLAKSKIQLPIQLERLGKSEIQNLLVQVSVKANEKIHLTLTIGRPNTIQTKTFGRYVPERKDDFAWENDKIAFRAYGKALQGTKEDAFGYDVWVKRTDKMIVNKRYAIGNYHIDSGNGLDYYHVGFSLGAGNMAPFVADSIRYAGNYQTYKILDNGPLRTTFQLFYNDYNINNTKVSLEKTISLDANSQLNKIQNRYRFSNLETMPVVAGIILRKNKEVILSDATNGIAGYWEPTDSKNGTTGVGIVFPSEIEKITNTSGQLLVATTAISKKEITYYAGACWDKANELVTAQQWFEYLYNFKTKLQNPLKTQWQ